MNIRDKTTGAVGQASTFNTHALAEVLVVYPDGGGDSAFIHDLDVQLSTGWKDMKQAFKERDLICDNLNTFFAEPNTPEDRERGYLL